MSRLRWLLPTLILLVWLGGAGPLSILGGKLSGLQENDVAAFLPDSAESTRVQELQSQFQPTESIPALLLWENPDGIDRATLGEIGARLEAATRIADDAGALVGQASPPIPSEDGQAVQALTVLGRAVDKSAFRKRMLDGGFMEEAGMVTGSLGRPAMSYRLRDRSQAALFPRTFNATK